MSYYFFNDINLTIMNKEIIHGFQMIREETLIRFYTQYGAIDMKYDNLEELIKDYDMINMDLHKTL